MTKSTFHGAVLLLTTNPGQEVAGKIAAQMAAEHFPNMKYGFSIQQELPPVMREDAHDQLAAHRADLPEGAVYLVLRPSGA
jgi:hypothetical protein